MSTHGLPSVHVYVLICSSYKDTGHIGLGLTQITFYCNYLFKGPFSKFSHSKVLGVRTSTYKFGRNIIQPIPGIILEFCRHFRILARVLRPTLALIKVTIKLLSLRYGISSVL